MALDLEQQLLVINELVPGAERRVVDNQLIWLDSRVQPTMVEIEAFYDGVYLSERKRIKKDQINEWRQEVFDSGMAYNFNGVIDIVQTRPEDKINLLGLYLESQILISNGIVEPMEFMPASNNHKLVTPVNMQELTLNAMTHIKNIYKRAWYLKGVVDNSTLTSQFENLTWEDSAFIV